MACQASVVSQSAMISLTDGSSGPVEFGSENSSQFSFFHGIMMNKIGPCWDVVTKFKESINNTKISEK